MAINIIGIRLWNLELALKLVRIRIRYALPAVQFVLSLAGATFVVWMLTNVITSLQQDLIR
ncbi:hypothetical protein L6255_03735 [Candidatus Parcubacteria bacterium]|nr:hypothetical protein [Patescibacteria group bacterium]MBU4380595.1 hypothetical protein [Patescibacteria group bacterium]MCG2689523.1 hypothetical protein [Candidatus Parcubacteria bacterium]